jgi:hypothetical protein
MKTSRSYLSMARIRPERTSGILVTPALTDDGLYRPPDHVSRDGEVSIDEARKGAGQVRFVPADRWRRSFGVRADKRVHPVVGERHDHGTPERLTS